MDNLKKREKLLNDFERIVLGSTSVSKEEIEEICFEIMKLLEPKEPAIQFVRSIQAQVCFCSECGAVFRWSNQNYCSQCGTAVKWK